MPNFFKDYQTDHTLESEGFDLDIDGAIFTLRRAGGSNRRYRYALATASQNHPKLFDEECSQFDKFVLHDQMIMEAFADGVIVGWQNVEDRDGNDWPCTKENFIELMSCFPDIWDQIQNAATEVDNYKADADIVGKS